MDTLLQGLFLLLKGLAEALLEWLFDSLCYTVGWLLLRALSLGRYPRLPLRLGDPTGSGARWVSALGLICLVALPLATLVVLYG